MEPDTPTEAAVVAENAPVWWRLDPAADVLDNAVPERDHRNFTGLASYTSRTTVYAADDAGTVPNLATSVAALSTYFFAEPAHLTAVDMPELVEFLRSHDYTLDMLPNLGDVWGHPESPPSWGLVIGVGYNPQPHAVDVEVAVLHFGRSDVVVYSLAQWQTLYQQVGVRRICQRGDPVRTYVTETNHVSERPINIRR